jgi:hypothetical protein
MTLRIVLVVLGCTAAMAGCSSTDGKAGRGSTEAGARPPDGASGESGGARSGNGGAGNGGSASRAGGGSNATGGASNGTGGAPTTGDAGGGTSVVADSGATVGRQLVSDFVGINAFIDDDVAKLAAVGNVREYHDWSWNDGNGAAGYPGYPDNQLEFSLFNGFWDFDAYYKKLGEAGSLVFPCIQGSVSYLKDAMPPVPAGASETDPASYVAHASMLYQYAARYGRAAVPAANLKLASGQTVASGLGYLPYYENGNEPDANWVKPAGALLFSPEATAAMTSADYDGNQGSLGKGFGIKAADPSAKLVLAGLAGSGPSDWVTNVTTYLDGMRAWSAAHRGGSFPADVLNVHDYCFGPDPFGTANPKPGLSPEECGLSGLLAKIVSYRDAKLPGKELWLTEFGYDTHPKSRLRAPAIGTATAEAVQGQWLVRSLLALFESGIDRAFIFVSRDSCTGTDTKCPSNAVQFSTSGVLTEKGDATPKTAWYYLATVRHRLGSMRYVGTSPSGNAKVSIARFYDAKTDKGAYVLWAPTSNGTVVNAFSLAVPSEVTTASIVTLTDKSETGTEKAGQITAGHLQTTVDETPTFILVNGEPQ